MSRIPVLVLCTQPKDGHLSFWAVANLVHFCPDLSKVTAKIF